MLDVARRLAAPPGAVWDTLINTAVWPQWGPSVCRATIDHGGTRLQADSTGRVQTAVGFWFRFRVTEWEEGRRWAWKVAGIPATAHRVEPIAGASATSLGIMEIPNWAPFYAPLCWVALGKVGGVTDRQAR